MSSILTRSMLDGREPNWIGKRLQSVLWRVRFPPLPLKYSNGDGADGKLLGLGPSVRGSIPRSPTELQQNSEMRLIG